MTNNLSKQLCKLCGIKPLYKIKTIELCKGGTITWRLFNSIDDARKYVKDDTGEVVEIFPDFLDPENFVKLLELQIAGNTLWRLIEYFSPVLLTNRERFLELLIQNLSLDAKTKFIDCLKTIARSIKQAIKNTEWNYE